uniref:L1 transposable element RRM domain-containing protein n=1 Tax=Kryptolebias marmoratus TaxID=37003 RepID=A0A3Q3FYM6_KRYMA
MCWRQMRKQSNSRVSISISRGSKSTSRKEICQHPETASDVSEQKDNMETMLAELIQLRKEHTDASNSTKITLSRVESSLKDVLERTTKLEQQITDNNQRVSDAEDQEANLSAKCKDLESRVKRNNLRIYGIPEGEEKNDMISFVIDLMRTSLKLPQDMDLCVERAHRSLNAKPKHSAPPRSIIVRFFNYRVKEKVIQMAWSRRDVTHHGRRIYFDQDYTVNMQKKRKKVREVIKQLKDKNVRAVSPFPAQLKIYLDSEHKISLFADDILTYISDPVMSVPSLMKTIEEYGKLSGYQINQSKSETIVIHGHLPTNLTD